MRAWLAALPRFPVYVAGGVLSALLDVGLMQLMLRAGSGHIAAVSAGFVAGLLFNYGFHAAVTFAAPASARSLARYLAVVAANYGLTLAAVELSVRLAGDPLPGKLLALPLVAAVGFVLGKRWIFNQQR